MAQKNTCDCPKPPGGRVVCEPGQFAICRVLQGELQMQCIDLPKRHAALLDLPPDQRGPLYNWVLSQVMLTERSESEAIDDAEWTTLIEGRYRAPGMEVRFRLPRGRSDGGSRTDAPTTTDWGFGGQREPALETPSA